MTRSIFITGKMLRNLGACSPQRRIFKRTFGEEMRLNRANIRRALTAGLDDLWLQDKLLGNNTDEKYAIDIRRIGAMYFASKICFGRYKQEHAFIAADMYRKQLKNTKD